MSSFCFALTHLASATPHFHLFALISCWDGALCLSYPSEPHPQSLSSHFEIAFLGSPCSSICASGVIYESDCTWDTCSTNVVDGWLDPGYKLDSSSLSFGSSGAWLESTSDGKSGGFLCGWPFIFSFWKLGRLSIFWGCPKLLVQGLLS